MQVAQGEVQGLTFVVLVLSSKYPLIGVHLVPFIYLKSSVGLQVEHLELLLQV